MSVEEKIIANEYLQGKWVTFWYLLKLMDSFHKFPHIQNASRDKKDRVYKFAFRCKNTWQQNLHCNSVERIYYKHTFSGMIPWFLTCFSLPHWFRMLMLIGYKKSETRITVSIPKQDPNPWKVKKRIQYKKGKFWVKPLFRATEQQLNNS